MVENSYIQFVRLALRVGVVAAYGSFSLSRSRRDFSALFWGLL